MDCSLLINTAYVTGEYYKDHIHINLEAKSNDCIVKIQNKGLCNPCNLCIPYDPCNPCNLCMPYDPCNPCNLCMPYDPCNPCSPHILYGPYGICMEFNQPSVIQLEESCSIIKLSRFKQLCEIYPVKCKLNWYTLQYSPFLEVECYYMVLYYSELGQRKSHMIYIKQYCKQIETRKGCNYRLKICYYDWKKLDNNKLEVNIQSVIEIN